MRRSVVTVDHVRTIRVAARTAVLLALALLPLACSSDHNGSSSTTQSPNILFIVMDDVGIDQMRSFGYGGATPASVPNLDAIAQAGVRFRNTWSAPECSPSRVMFFEGRYPFRTHVVNALANTDLANAQLSPFEVTTPKLLANHGYANAFFGKFHLSGPYYNPYENSMPAVLGWNYFYGFIEGTPYPLDTTAGGAGAEDTYPCGFVPDSSQPNGADTGACYLSVSGPCSVMSASPGEAAPGLRCLQSGGVFMPNAACEATAPANLTFDEANGYYVSPLVINETDGSVVQVPYSDPRARQYRTTLETDAAIDWINARDPAKPWMANVSFSAIHTPYQQPPMSLLPDGTPDNSNLDCIDQDDQRALSNETLEALDSEVGRLLVSTHLATRNPDGTLHYDPMSSNTWVIVIADNGSYLTVVKAPFDPERAKGTIYQTGTWVPFMVAGPKVAAPGRSVDSMVNVADLFVLFGEIAGIDVRKEVPASHQLDAQPVMPYLVNANPQSIRKTNFTYTGTNVKAASTVATACVIPSGDVELCTETLPTKNVCETQNGIWYGTGADIDTSKCGSDGCATCCTVQINYLPELQILPDSAAAIRNDTYKLIENHTPDCNESGQVVTSYEFYQINENAPLPMIDREDSNLLTSPDVPAQGLDSEQLANFNALYAELQTLLGSEIDCPGDGNEDLLVNQADIDNWTFFSGFTGQSNSSWYDFNLDGLTDDQDLQIIEDHLGADCRPK